MTDRAPQTAVSDAELVIRCQENDPNAFRTLVERYRRRSWKVAYNVIGHMEVARDISQEAFVRVFQSIGTCDPQRGFRPWFDRVVVNLSIDYLRRHRRQPAVPLESVAERASAEEGPRQITQRDELRQRVHEVLGTLPMKHRSLLVMRDIDGMSCEDIAEAVGKSSGTVRWRLSRARQAFKRAWERHGHAASGDN